MINLFNDKRLSDITVIYSSQKISAHKVVLATHSTYFKELFKRSPTVSRLTAHPYGATELTDGQILEIDLGNEHNTVATAAFLKDLYSTVYISSSPELPLSFFAEMYLLAEKHGRPDAVDMYKARCREILGRTPCSDRYFAGVAALCGPGSSRYAISTLPDAVFEEFSIRVVGMENEEFQRLKHKVKDGSLFNATFLGRFALEMLERNRAGGRVSL
jgi:hypothetical protein